MPKLRWHLLVPATCLVLALLAGSVVADTSYVVQPGDTLTHLALRFDTTVHALVVANEIVNPDLIRVGQVLTIPDNGVSTTYVVQPGDVLSELAVRSGVSIELIAAANAISDVDLVFAGQSLIIPDGFIPPYIPTNTPRPTPTPTPRPAPAPTPLPTATPTLRTINVDNAERAGQVGRIGQGTILKGALSADGGTLALSGSLGVWLYDYASLAFLDFFQVPEGNARAVSWSPDGGKLVLGLSGRGTGAQVWDVAQGRAVHTLETENTLRSVAWSPDGRHLAAVGSGGEIYIWDASTGEIWQMMPGHDRLGYSVAWSPDSARLASGGFDGAVMIWDPGRAELWYQIDAVVAVLDVAWSHDGEKIAAATGDGARVWDAATGEELARFEVDDDLFIGWSVAWSPDDTEILVGSLARGYVWPVQGDRARLTLQGADFLQVIWSPDGEELAVVGWDGTVQVLDAVDGALLRSMTAHGARFIDMALSPDETRFLLAGMDGSVRLWLASGEEKLRLPTTFAELAQSVAWSPDGSLVASGGSDGTVRIWDAASGEQVHVIAGTETDILALDWSPDGTKLAATSGEGVVNVWDAETGEAVLAIAGFEALVTDVAWSPDGAFLGATGDFGDPTVLVWRAADWQQVHALEGHGSRIDHLAWSPDGTQIASADSRGVIILWEAASGQQIKTWELPEGFGMNHAGSLAWSPDGSMLATGAVGGTIYLCESQSGRELARLSGHEDGVTGLAWAADGLLLLSGSQDGTVRLWGVADDR